MGEGFFVLSFLLDRHWYKLRIINPIITTMVIRVIIINIFPFVLPFQEIGT